MIANTPFRELMRIVNLTGSYEFTYIYDGDTLVARKNSDGSIQYDHADHLGSIGVLTNQTGNVLENTLYEPFGDVSSGGTKEVKLYTGHFSDELTNQYYYGQRYYKPTTGQFISADPTIQYIYSPQSLNRYSYVMNNPYKYIDPFGLWTLQAGLSLSGGLGELAPIAGTVGVGFVISYDEDAGTGQFGAYRTAGSGVLIGSPGLGGSIDFAYNPSNKNVKDIGGKAVSVGIEAPILEGVTAGVGLSYPQDNNGNVLVDSDATDITGSLGAGFKASVYTYGTSTKTISTRSIKVSSTTKQVTNANQAQNNKNQKGTETSKGSKNLNTVKSTISNIVKSVKKNFGGKK
ncbi:MAG: RHS repeat-associated core domain-containing protein [Nanoarchaeota archaeon]|nr:RHS repeat-associated core domain-containing protein [Nanoarchaeota archaeon]